MCLSRARASPPIPHSPSYAALIHDFDITFPRSLPGPSIFSPHLTHPVMAQDGRPDSPSTTPVSSPTISASPSSDHSSTSVQTATDKKGTSVKSLMENTSDRLGKNKSLLSRSQPALPQSSHKRMLGLTRGHGKERQTQAGALFAFLADLGSDLTFDLSAVSEDQPTSHSQQLPPSSPPHSPRKPHRFPGVLGDDESPFITPTSPPLGPSCPESLIFRGFRSVCPAQ